MRFPLNIYVDFDGTISLKDTTDLLLQQYATFEWYEIEASWERGEIGSDECLARQVSLLRLSPDEYRHWLKGIPLDQDFPRFALFCERQALSITIVSDGIDRTIEAALAQFDLDLPILANRLDWQGEDRWKLSFPYAKASCTSLSGHCKCASLSSGDDPIILIGDGRSDFCAAEKATLTFAKGKLLDHCRNHDLPHLAYSTFSDLIPTFAKWFMGQKDENFSTIKETSFTKEFTYVS